MKWKLARFLLIKALCHYSNLFTIASVASAVIFLHGQALEIGLEERCIEVRCTKMLRILDSHCITVLLNNL